MRYRGYDRCSVVLGGDFVATAAIGLQSSNIIFRRLEVYAIEDDLLLHSQSKIKRKRLFLRHATLDNDCLEGHCASCKLRAALHDRSSEILPRYLGLFSISKIAEDSRFADVAVRTVTIERTLIIFQKRSFRVLLRHVPSCFHCRIAQKSLTIVPRIKFELTEHFSHSCKPITRST